MPLFVPITSASPTLVQPVKSPVSNPGLVMRFALAGWAKDVARRWHFQCCRVKHEVLTQTLNHLGRSRGEPQVLENDTNGSLQSSKQEFPAVTFHSLHRCNQRCQTGAIDVSHARKIDHQTSRLVVDHGIQ